jgi:hypothetical protein
MAFFSRERRRIRTVCPRRIDQVPDVFIPSYTRKLTAIDINSEVDKNYYTINSSDYIDGTSFIADQEGVNQVSFYSVDEAGNKEESQTIEVKLDKTAPIITSIVYDFYVWGSKLDLTYSTKDLLSGVSSEVVMLKSPNDSFGKVLKKLDQIYLFQPGMYTLTILATDAVGNAQVSEKIFTVYIPTTIEVTQHVIRGSIGEFTLRVELPEIFEDYKFDLDTAELNGVKAVNSHNEYYNQAKKGQFKFERSSFQWAAGEQEIEFRCYLYGYLVIGHTNVQVKN